MHIQVRYVGCTRNVHTGFMLVIGRSGAQSDWPHVPFPPLEGFGAARMHVAGLQVLVQPLSDRSVRCCYCCNIDLRAPLPRPLVHLATQHVVHCSPPTLTLHTHCLATPPFLTPSPPPRCLADNLAMLPPHD